jgi:prepilin-type N-terminal cleavage/methylation domain-containing protein
MKLHVHKWNQKGFSIVEVILAAALFVILATGSVTVILQGIDSNRLGEEQTVANQYASEGIEATRSIQNQNFASLVNTAGTGIIPSAYGHFQEVIIFSVVNIHSFNHSDVQRDGGGNIGQWWNSDL